MDILGAGLRCVTLPAPQGRAGEALDEATTSVFEPAAAHDSPADASRGARRGSSDSHDTAAGPGLPLLLLPALGLDGRSFALLAPLSVDRRLVFWNPPNVLPRTIDELADLVLSHADRAGLPRRFAIGGSSLGGMLAARIALRAPDRIAALVLLGCCPSWAQLKWWFKLSRLLQPLLPRRGYNRRLARILVPTGGELACQLRTQMEHRTKEYVESILTAMLNGGGFDLRPHLSRVRAPTLVVHGEDDHIAPLDEGRTWLRIPNAELRVIEGAAHLPYLSHADDTGHAIESFLAHVDHAESGA